MASTVRKKHPNPVYLCEKCRKPRARSVPCNLYNHERAHLNHMLCPDCILSLGGNPTKRYGVIKGNKVERRFIGITPSEMQCPVAPVTPSAPTPDDEDPE